MIHTLIYTMTEQQTTAWYDYQSNSDSHNRKEIVNRVTRIAFDRGYNQAFLYDCQGSHIDTFKI
jgi:hypothetical protein